MLVHIGNKGLPVLRKGESGLFGLYRNGGRWNKAVGNAVVIGAEHQVKAFGLQRELVKMITHHRALENGSLIKGIHAPAHNLFELGAGAPERAVGKGEADGRGLQQLDTIPCNAVS